MKKFFNKSDLKQIDKIQITEETVFYNETIKELYEKFKNLSKLDYRLYESSVENFEYLDLSGMDLTSNALSKIIIKNKNIFLKIPFLDISNNNITELFNLNEYPNITVLIVSDNQLNTINTNYIVELNCCNNNISSINGKNLKDVNASNNKIESINLPSIQKLSIYNNPIIEIPYFENLTFLECSVNKISKNYNIEHVYKDRNKYNVEIKID